MLHETVLLNADAEEELAISKNITYAKTVALENCFKISVGKMKKSRVRLLLHKVNLFYVDYILTKSFIK